MHGTCQEDMYCIRQSKTSSVYPDFMPGTVTETADQGLNPICNLFQSDSFWLLFSTHNAQAGSGEISKVPGTICTYESLIFDLKLN